MVDTLEEHSGVSKCNEDVILNQAGALDGYQVTSVTMLLIPYTCCADNVVVGGLDVSAVR